MDDNDLGDSVVPVYHFEWDDGTERTTAELVEQLPTAVENLATLGQDDPECTVKLVGYSS